MKTWTVHVDGAPDFGCLAALYLNVLRISPQFEGIMEDNGRKKCSM